MAGNSTETLIEEGSSMSLFQCIILLSYNLTGDGVLAKSLAGCKDVGSEALGGPALRTATILFGLVIIVPNMLIALGIIRGHALHKPMYYLIGNIAVVGALAGTVCLSVPLLLHSDGAQSPIQALYTTLFFTLYLSLIGITLLSVDRYVSVHYSLFYNTTITGRQAAAGVVTAWLVSGLLCYSVLLGWNCENLDIRADRCIGQLDGNYIILLTAIIIIVMLIVVYTNVSIYLNIRRRLQALENGQLGANVDAQHISSAQRKAVALWIVVVIFFVSWLPFLVQIIRFLNTFYLTTMEQRLATGSLAGWGVAIVFCYIFALANPIVYAFRLPALRNEVRRQLGACWSSVKRCCVRSQVAPSENFIAPRQIVVASNFNSAPVGVFTVPTRNAAASGRVDPGVQVISVGSEASRDPSCNNVETDKLFVTRRTYYDALKPAQSNHSSKSATEDLPMVAIDLIMTS
ncbi:melanocyte-stimulating hormone receptor-like [Branchiostoma floridae]|uniref:Melanocyte-stimulating hormone receptor-like n=1 Tax=Branchiostoma floridae TaxID=7739 RepID=C3Z933_BRAFL|nr:melanocyte-stimulating hormone receptor-like [Branchiostoma floridae]|eukprot:XP_002594934.1 hypothetical protein BRAFLDRAFT_103731 [Branchiostoma floridae]